MAINLHTKYATPLSKRFTLESKTDAFAGKKFDFDGLRSIVVSTADKVTINDYNRSASSNRFGTPAELGDTTQTLTMGQDKSFVFAIDAGNASDQQYIKKVNDISTAWDDSAFPVMYRLMVNGAMPLLDSALSYDRLCCNENESEKPVVHHETVYRGLASILYNRS